MMAIGDHLRRQYRLLGEHLAGQRHRQYATYTADTLRARLDAFEARYGMPSEEWAERYAHGERLAAEKAEPGLAGFDETVWSSLWREYLRLRELERERT